VRDTVKTEGYAKCGYVTKFGGYAKYCRYTEVMVQQGDLNV